VNDCWYIEICKVRPDWNAVLLVDGGKEGALESRIKITLAIIILFLVDHGVC
jgi:hypothetical protein